MTEPWTYIYIYIYMLIDGCRLGLEQRYSDPRLPRLRYQGEERSVLDMIEVEGLPSLLRRLHALRHGNDDEIGEE
jgi:hypothetical protein